MSELNSFVHPHVWRAIESPPTSRPTVPTAHGVLDRWLPGQGWPLGTLIEVMHPAPGCGEIELVAPALGRLPHALPIVLLQPPLVPNALAWAQWQVQTQRLWWVQPRQVGEARWCAEQILQGQSFGALLCWIDPIDHKTLRRLQLCAQDSSTLVFLFRPMQAALQPSPAALRLRIVPNQANRWQLELLKCRGPRPSSPLILSIEPDTASRMPAHATVDRTAHDLARI